MPMPMTPLRKNHLALVLLKPRPARWANPPRTSVAMTRRPRLARTGPFARTLWLAQVALSAKKNAARNEASTGKSDQAGDARARPRIKRKDAKTRRPDQRKMDFFIPN